jgi:hypothetical protein
LGLWKEEEVEDYFPSISTQPAEVDMQSTLCYAKHTPLNENALPDLLEHLRPTLMRLMPQVECEPFEPLAGPYWHIYIEARVV